jgi:Cu+-exporting ATPase
MEKVQWKIDGMHCANCALTINKYLQNKGAKNVSVNAMDGNVSFEVVEEKQPAVLAKGVESLGYKVETTDAEKTDTKKPSSAVIYSDSGFVFRLRLS